MNRILKLVQEKAFMLILLGSMLAAVVAGVWAMNTVQQNLNQSNQLTDSTQEEFDGFAEDAEQSLVPEGESIWDEPADIVTDEMNGEIAMDEPEGSSSTAQEAATTHQAAVLEPGADGANGQELPPELSTDASGASSSSEPSEASAILEPQGVSVTPSFVLPVSGAMLQAFSGDELVYNETLGDWRTHNGADYAADLGEAVIAPVAGEIIAVTTDGNWGGVVELQAQDGAVWRFCGVENSTLQVGDTVGISDILGYIGIVSAESAATPHLHLEVLVAGVYQDPACYLQ